MIRHVPFFALLGAVLVYASCGPKGSHSDVASTETDADLRTTDRADLPSEVLADAKHGETRCAGLLETCKPETQADVPGPGDVMTLPDAFSDMGGEAFQPPQDALDTADSQGAAETDSVDAIPLPESLEVGDLWLGGQVVKVCGNGFLSTLPSPSGDIGILVLRGPHGDMGRQAGCLVGMQVGEFFGNLMAYFLQAVLDEVSELGLTPEQTTTILVSMLNNLWLKMEPFVPAAYLEELAGFEEAVLDDPAMTAMWGQTQPLWGLHALVLLANISDLNWSGSFEEVLEKITEGASDPLQDYYLALLANMFQESLRGPLGHSVSGGVADYVGKSPMPLKTSCSFFSAWGKRTVNGHLVASRNLDWSTDTGISVLKGITIYVPESGHAHAAIGYLGFPGALAGMGEQGLVVSEVGSESVMERLTGQPWTLKFREILEFSDGLDSAVQIATGTTTDGMLRPPTIGYNWMIAYGDPPNGTGASAAAVESNGLRTGVLRAGPDCVQESLLVEFDEEGAPATILTHEDDPLLVNLEGEAVEVDADGMPRHFAIDGDGKVLLDSNGCPSTQDGQGIPFVTGHPLACALFRGDEALLHGVRMFQLASNGPQGGQSLLCTSGSYRHRYLVMHDMLDAFSNGLGYSKDGKTLIEPSSEAVPVGLPQGEVIARAAAMSSNVLSVVYDATALRIRVSWETGTGPEWQGAHQHEYIELPLGEMFAFVKQLPAGEGGMP